MDKYFPENSRASLGIKKSGMETFNENLKRNILHLQPKTIPARKLTSREHREVVIVGMFSKQTTKKRQAYLCP